MGCKILVKAFLTIFVASLPLIVGASSDGQSLPITHQHTLPQAIQIKITEKGMKIFDRRLSEILGNLGVSIEEGYFPNFTYTAERDINLDDYQAHHPEAVAMYKQLRDLLSHWLVGFSLNNHRPVIQVGESGYIAKFSRFGLVTDHDLMRILGKSDGAILAIELELQKISVNTQSILVWDLNNEFIGKTGFDDATISIGDSSIPLKIRIPFYIHKNLDGLLEFEALEVENNAEAVALGFQYKKLILPTFAVEINGKKYYLNDAELDRYFQNQAPFMIEKLRQNLGTFARIQLPQILNQKMKQYFKGGLEQVQDMAPPGESFPSKRPPLKWGLQLQNIDLKKSLHIDFNAFVEDPLNLESVPSKKHEARKLPNYELLSDDQYDLVLGINRSLINRVLQLSYLRKNFSNIPQSDGSSLKLRATPVVDFIKPPANIKLGSQETFVKIRVTIERTTDSIFLKSPFIISFDIFAKLRPSQTADGMEMVLYSIDSDSLDLDDSYLTWAGILIKSQVHGTVKEELQAKSDLWKVKTETIPGTLSLPPELLGIKLNINRVTMDPSGYLVMYLDYKKTGGSQ